MKVNFSVKSDKKFISSQFYLSESQEGKIIFR